MKQHSCGCIYDEVIEGYAALCEHHSLNGLINEFRRDDLKVPIVKSLSKTEGNKKCNICNSNEHNTEEHTDTLMFEEQAKHDKGDTSA